MRRHTLGLALSAILAPSFSYALGLGEISTNSALNQPLDAQIEMVSTTVNEVGGVSVRVAPDAVFEQVGISRSPVLDQLSFQPTVENGVPVINVTSNAPIQEPFVNFIVEVSWPKGKLLREYTVLLDPPVLGGAVATAPVAAVPAPVESVVEPLPMDTAPVSGGLPPFLEEPIAVEPIADADLEPTPVDEIPMAQTFPVDSIDSVASPDVEAETYAVSEPLPPFMDSGASVATAMQADGSDTETFPVDTTVAEIDGTSEIFVTPPGDFDNDESSSSYFDGDSYPVQKGDTLFSIAKQTMSGSANIHQMMVALLQDNPKAFIKGDMNRLKAGYILRVPDEETVAAIDRRDAKAQVLAATQTPAAYGQYKDAASATATPQGDVDSSASIAGLAALDKRVKQAAEAGGAVADNAKKGLEILVPGKDGDAAGGEEAGERADDARNVAFLREKLSSTEQENAELQSRVSELETLLEAKNRLIELKDEQLADLQDQLTGGAAKVDGLVETTEAPEAEAKQTKGLLTEAEKDMPVETLVDKAKEAAKDTQEAVTDTTAELVDEAQEPGLVENIKSNPNLLMGAGIGALLLSGLAWMAFRRKDEGKVRDEIEEPIPEAPEVGDEAGALAAIDELDTGDVEIERATEFDSDELDLTAELSEADLLLASDIVPPEEEAIDNSFDELISADDDANEDEVLSEANVYLAYGLQDQAIDLLKPAVDAHPDRSDYVAKLAEAYHASGNKDAFLDTAAKLNKQVTPEQQELWHRVAVLGKDMAPDHNLFVNADTGGLTMTQIRQKPDDLDLDVKGEDTELGDDGTISMPAEFTADLNEAIDDLPEESDLPDLDELSKSLQIEEDEAIRALRESADINLDLDNDEIVDATQVAAPFGEHDASEQAEDAVDRLKSDVDESVAEFDSRTLGLNLSGVDEDFSLSEMEEDLTSMTTGADEMSTKLDLAKAYIDMGDDEGAREALDEVISNGTDEQQEAAKKLLGQLS